MTQNNVEFLEQIAQLLENLPGEQLLQQAKTSEQIEEWHSQRKGNQIIAQGIRDKFYPSLNPIETKKLKNNFSGDDFQMSWMTLTIFACQFAGSINSSLKDK
ncbi:hypothetical protein IQ264_18140 [Phormidium sp. LEGE 05292]|uniref:hypothetical protein n=1 Tax=[Phormidium] sp. LEGE 05292 TaxID=767427 RepID=UPI00187E90EB|nr:hypothetical protein [Phormidium sp. LEGE 05292]MBE9227351.1 hypothetical protein [Phormidium sp. LEGE 05292]